MLPREVFLSHSDRDRVFAGKIADLLKRHGIPTWYSPHRILGAAQWHDQIGAALHGCDWFVILLSPHAIDSIWVKRELLFALSQKRLEGKILPVLYQSCDFTRLSWTLPSFQIVDFTKVPPEEGYRALLRVWGVGLRQDA
jgi:hypothetical protein